MGNTTFYWAIALTSIACGAPTATPADAPRPGGAERPELTRAQCEAQGGGVVNDIGDGATRRPGYACQSGKRPLGNVLPPEGGPIAVEGAVCCPR